MLLAIDVGNSRITIGLGDRHSWLSRWHLATEPRRTVDEYGFLVDALLARRGSTVADVSSTVLGCVVPSLTPVVSAMCSRLFGCQPLVVGPGIRTGIEVRYDPVTALGADRLVDAIAARSRHGAPLVVVDLGTATTFNVIDRSGAFVGGAIAPGVGIAAEALAESGARLQRFDLSPPRAMPFVGRSTEHSMRSGVLYGFAGLVEGLLDRLTSELEPGAPETVPVVATGGMADVVAPLVQRIGTVDPDLTLDGLRIVAELNGPVTWATP